MEDYLEWLYKPEIRTVSIPFYLCDKMESINEGRIKQNLERITVRTHIGIEYSLM